MDIENENKNEKKIKHESTTMCIVHSTLRDATTPYTERWQAFKMTKSILIKIIAILFTLISFRCILIFIRSDFFASIYPSWNVTVYAEFWALNYRTLIYGIATLTMIAIFRFWKLILTKLFNS